MHKPFDKECSFITLQNLYPRDWWSSLYIFSKLSSFPTVNYLTMFPLFFFLLFYTQYIFCSRSWSSISWTTWRKTPANELIFLSLNYHPASFEAYLSFLIPYMVSQKALVGRISPVVRSFQFMYIFMETVTSSFHVCRFL